MNARAVVGLLGLTCLLAGCGPGKTARQWAHNMTGGDPAHGRAAIEHYGCIACHTIDGIQSEALVGPPLTRMAGRSYVAGSLPNNPANLIKFIQHPHAARGQTAMPEMNVTDSDARDIAAYLYQFR